MTEGPIFEPGLTRFNWEIKVDEEGVHFVHPDITGDLWEWDLVTKSFIRFGDPFIEWVKEMRDGKQQEEGSATVVHKGRKR